MVKFHRCRANLPAEIGLGVRTRSGTRKCSGRRQLSTSPEYIRAPEGRTVHSAYPRAIRLHPAPELMDASLERRANRGEMVPGLEWPCRWRCWPADRARSSRRLTAIACSHPVLVLRSSKGAYYQSAGNSPDGHETGVFSIPDLADRQYSSAGGNSPLQSGRHRRGQSWAATIQGWI